MKVAAIALAIVLMAAVSVEAGHGRKNIHELLSKFILPNTAKLDGLVGKVVTPQMKQQLKDAVKKDLAQLQKNLSPANIEKLQNDIIGIIDHPSSLFNTILKKI